MEVAKDRIVCKCNVCGNEWELLVIIYQEEQDVLNVLIGFVLEVRNKKAMEKAIKIAGDKWIVEPFKMEFGERLSEKYITIKCKNCGTPRSVNLDKFLDKNRDRECANCKGNSFSNGRSKQEIEVQSFIDNILEKYGLKSYSSMRIIPNPLSYKNYTFNHSLNYEIDILNLAFEYNGIYWHSDKVIQEKTKGYFKKAQYKTSECKKLGIDLIHIFEKDYIENKEKSLNSIYDILTKRLNISDID